MKKKPALIWAAFAIVVVLLLSWNRIFPHAPSAIVTNPSDLPGMQTNAGEWIPEIANLRARLTDIGLPALAAEGNVLHIHQHLNLYINGNPVIIPAFIGINEPAGFISPIHVHDTSGVIHVESNVVRDYTLGEFFDIWGVLLTNDCIGGYCATGSSTLKVYSNGTLYTGDLRAMVLLPHQEIMMVYGTSTPPIVSSYTFPEGY